VFRSRQLRLVAAVFTAILLAGCAGGGSKSVLPPIVKTPSNVHGNVRSTASFPPSYGRNVIVAWNQLALQAVRDEHPGPPIVARTLAILNTCIYDAWAAYDSKALGTQYGASLRRPEAERTSSNKEKAISYAAYRALVDLFPQLSEAPLFAGLMTAQGFDINETSVDVTTPSGIGNAACAKVLAFRHHDGSNQLGDLGGSGPYADYTGFVSTNTSSAINDPNAWQPLRIVAAGVTQKYIAPYWGQVAPFALTSPSQYLPSVGPATYTPGAPASVNQHYIDQANEVVAYSAGLTDTQKVIAEYWADGPHSELPPGHWNLFAQFVSNRDRNSLKKDAKMFFAVSNAILDASIAAWGTKRVYVSVRPVTAIHYLYTGTALAAWTGPGQGTHTFDGGLWTPYQAATVITPPFPEYVSGHSAFSAAGAQILRYMTHSDSFGASYTNLAGVSRVEPGMTPATNITLTWPTFTAAADEAGISRRYGGIHFIDGDLQGRSMGRHVADIAWQKALMYFNDGEFEGDDRESGD
jgi:hypothetical protein